MPAPTTHRKPLRPRVNIPLAIPLDEANLVERALYLTDESRNEFYRVAALERAERLLAEHGITPAEQPAA